MECPQGSEEGARLAVSFVAGRLDIRTSAAFERHSEVCPKCRALVAGQQALWSALDAWQPEAVSNNFDKRLFERIAAQGHSPWRFRLDWRSALPAAAACAILTAAFLVKQPAIAPPPPRVQIEQVERALDDIDMLSQLHVESPANPARAGAL